MKRLLAAAAAALFVAAVHPALAETTLHVMSWQPAYVAGTRLLGQDRRRVRG